MGTDGLQFLCLTQTQLQHLPTVAFLLHCSHHAALLGLLLFLSPSLNGKQLESMGPVLLLLIIIITTIVYVSSCLQYLAQSLAHDISSLSVY